MPRLSGREVAAKILGECPNLKMVVTSGNGGTIVEYLPDFPNAIFLAKPYGLAELFGVLR